jgi:hypothetical protein
VQGLAGVFLIEDRELGGAQVRARGQDAGGALEVARGRGLLALRVQLGPARGRPGRERARRRALVQAQDRAPAWPPLQQDEDRGHGQAEEQQA